jgi:hypothetical protein
MKIHYFETDHAFKNIRIRQLLDKIKTQINFLQVYKFPHVDVHVLQEYSVVLEI